MGSGRFRVRLNSCGFCGFCGENELMGWAVGAYLKILEAREIMSTY
jgi:hypothetical protein